MGTIIIAEAGVNHNGDINIAKKLIDAASDAGVDYVKFQTFKANNLVTKSAPKADYQKKNDPTEATQLEMLQKLELSETNHIELIDYCKLKNIKFLSTAFDLDSITFLADKGLDFIKIPSGEITNYPYLERCAQLSLPIILSTGMSCMDEVKQAIAIIKQNGVALSNLYVLHCTTEYPTPMNEVNLLAMKTMADELNVNVGYSDHTRGIEIPVAAVALGATIIEKHFTLDKNMEGPDHKASLEPLELKAMVKAIRNVEQALGNGVKVPSPSEIKNIAIARKSIYLLNSLKKGMILSESDIVMKRPGNGISPMEYKKVLGKTIKSDLDKDHQLTWEDLE